MRLLSKKKRWLQRLKKVIEQCVVGIFKRTERWSNYARRESEKVRKTRRGRTDASDRSTGWRDQRLTVLTLRGAKYVTVYHHITPPPPERKKKKQTCLFVHGWWSMSLGGVRVVSDWVFSKYKGRLESIHRNPGGPIVELHLVNLVLAV